MRLPWPFRRAKQVPAATATAAAPAAWRELEPLPSTLGEAPLTAPTPPFAADLAGAQPLPPVLDQLGHARGLKAPAGLAVGVARPVAAPAAASTPAAPALQRRRRVSGKPIEASPDDPETAPDLPPVMPLRPPVAATADAHRSLIGVPPEDIPALAHRRGLVGQAQPNGPSATVPAASEMVTPPRETGSQHAPETGRTAPPALLAQLRAEGRERLTLGQARRLGLGLGAPISVTVTAAGGDMPSARLPLPQRAAASADTAHGDDMPTDESEPGTADASIQRAPRSTATDAAQAPSPKAEAVRGRPDGDGSGEVAAAARSGRSPIVTESGSTLRVARRPIEPLIGARSLRTMVRRAARNAASPASTELQEGRAGAMPAGGAPAELDTQGVRVHRGPEAAEMAGALDARAFTHQGEIYLPAAHGPLGAPPARALLAHELTHVAQQRTFGADLPHEDTAVGRQLEAQARAAEAGGRLPLAARPERPAQPAAPSLTPAAGLGAPIDRRADERPADRRQPDATATVPQGDMVEVPPVALPSAQRAADDAATPPAATTGPAKRSEEELEELARQLYGRIGLRLRHDLLMERERVGLGVDL
jgi:Domain of unknown function (DUF4157)